jgi:hypothetical protein
VSVALEAMVRNLIGRLESIERYDLAKRVEMLERAVKSSSGPRLNKSTARLEEAGRFHAAVAAIDAAHPTASAKEVARKLPPEFLNKSVRAVQWHLTAVRNAKGSLPD